MRFYTLPELQPGMILGHSIYDAKGRLILTNGKSLDTGFITRLSELGFSGAYVDEPGFETVKPPEIVEASLRAGTQLVIDDCFTSISELSGSILEFDGTIEDSFQAHPELKEAIPLGKIQDKVSAIVEDLTSQFATELPCLLLKAQSQYEVAHAMDTMLISVIMGINFGFIYRELRQLGLAALLHDVGKALLASPDQRLVGPDHPHYEYHPYIGSLILVESGTNHYNESAAVHQHHERQDGKGFPEGHIGYNKLPSTAATYHRGTIYRLAEIISVADAYDVLTSGAYQPVLSPERAVQNIMKRNFYEFNSHVVNMLARIIQVFPIGSPVQILKSSDHFLIGCRGVVETANKEHPHRVDLVLTHDTRGNTLKPKLVSLANDETAQLDMVL